MAPAGEVQLSAIALPETYYSNRLFSSILSAGGWTANHPGSEAYLVVGRIVRAGKGLAALLQVPKQQRHAVSLTQLLSAACGPRKLEEF